MLEHLVKELPPRTPVLCVFFEQKPAFPLTLNNLLGSLLKQLIQVKDTALPTGIKDAYSKAARIRAKLTSQEMKGLLQVGEALVTILGKFLIFLRQNSIFMTGST